MTINEVFFINFESISLIQLHVVCIYNLQQEGSIVFRLTIPYTEEWLVGSVCNHCLHHCKAPLIVVRPPVLVGKRGI